ncbi:D-alanyl-D-alanine carboxypeptidase [Streptomyces sp. NPDC058195]|uniref:D-alanyl-D-alanine carboxypeptidase n=1 Tax=Streptomyces sp. NPDC058195 TaxID=3346375 RepID=UPI0036EF3BCD
MEEASVAGESPDKSEQQKSSGTARSASDPRLAVFREESADDTAAEKSDTATAVFRTKPTAEDEDTASENEDAAVDVAEGAEGAEKDTATAVFRTKSAKADAGEGDGAEGDADTSADVSGSEGSEGSEGADGAVSAEGAEETEDAGKGAERPEKAPEASECADDAEGEEAEADEPSLDVPSGASDASGGDKAASAEEKPEPEKAEKAEKPEQAAKAAKADGKKGEDKPEAEPESKADEQKADAKAEAEPEVKKADAKAEAEPDVKKADDGDAEEKRGVDQPTAIFRAPAPRVDQPTTALKVPPLEPKSGTKPGAGSEAEAGAAAERASTFVPLRSDDVHPAKAPAPRRPEAPGAGAEGAPVAEPASLARAERTTQQPMPPKAPLDLLAELTNTPPPPETPVRNAVRRVKIWTPLALLALIVFAIAQMVRPLPEPVLQMSAKDTYTFKGSKPTLPWPSEGQGYMAATGLGQVGSFGEQKAVPIGSVAKAMTAYIVLKEHPLKKGEKGPSIDVDAKAESDGKLDAEGESTLNTVSEGDKLTQQEALAAIMIPSANNIARLLARWDAGSEAAFVKKMNETATSLGMKNTVYTDPSGLNATTVSSAEDQVKLGQKLVEIPALMEITKLPSWTDPSGKQWRNYNTLVPYNGALGIKTGSTSKAGGNLLFAAHKMVGDTDQLIVGAVLGQHQPPIIDTVNAVSRDVMVATQDLLDSAKVVKKGDVVGTVDNGFGTSVPVVATKDVTAVGWAGLTVRIELTDDGKAMVHGAASGSRVGTLTVGEGTSQVKVPVALQGDLAEPTFADKLTRIS